MKTTIEISDDLLARARRLAKKENSTLRALTESALRKEIEEKEARAASWKWQPKPFAGKLTEEFANATWEDILDEIYRGRGT